MPDTLSVIITTLGGATTTLTSPPGGGVTVLDAPLTSSNGTEITGIEGITHRHRPARHLHRRQPGGDRRRLHHPAARRLGGRQLGRRLGPETLTAANLAAVGSPNGVIFTVSAAHTYAEEGTYAYTVTVTDDGGSVTIFSGSAIIADAALSPSATQPAVNTTEASIFPVPVFAPPVFNGPGRLVHRRQSRSSTIADFTATIDWGDGTPLTAGTVSQPGGVGTAFIVSGSHTYADSGVNGGTGTYPIQVFVAGRRRLAG